jgi:hypothetical protein
VRTQKTILWSCFNICQVIYLNSHNTIFPPNNPSIIPKPVQSSSNQNLITGLKFQINELDHHKMKLKQRPNTAKKLNTESTNLPLPIATQLMKKVKTNSTKPVLKVCQNLLQFM